MAKPTPAQRALLARAESERVTYDEMRSVAVQRTILACARRKWIQSKGEADYRTLYALTDAGRAALEEAKGDAE